MFFLELLEYSFAPSEHFKRLANEVWTHTREGNVEKIIETARHAIALYPEHAYMYVVRGCAYLYEGEFELAITDLSKALELKGFDDRGYIICQRAVAHHHLDHKTEAIDDYAEALRIGLEPEQVVSALANRAAILASIGQLERAERHYLDIFRFAPHEKEMVYTRLAYAMLKAENYERTIHYLTLLIAFDPTQQLAYANRGYAYIKQNNWEAALADLDEAIRLDPEGVRAYNNRGFAHLQFGNIDMAMADYQRAVEIDPKFSFPYAGIGDIHFVKGEYETAMEQYRKAYELQPELPSAAAALAGQAIAYYALGKTDEAVKLWSVLIESDARYMDIDWIKKLHGWIQPILDAVTKIIAIMPQG